MQIEQFQKVAAQLLTTHYGLELNDTPLCEDRYVQGCIDNDQRPFEAVAEHVGDCMLDRIDLEGPCGLPSQEALSAEDEATALAVVNLIKA